jgi:hypothetical protein
MVPVDDIFSTSGMRVIILGQPCPRNSLPESASYRCIFPSRPGAYTHFPEGSATGPAVVQREGPEVERVQRTLPVAAFSA